MKKIKKLVIGNWKMNPESLNEAKDIFSKIKRGVKKVKKTDVVICPPFVYIEPISVSLSSEKNLFIGSQNVFYESNGPFTGEISSEQLKNIGVKFVIIGHSERRLAGEDDSIINKKIKTVLGDDMSAILCVGEKERDIHGDYLEEIKNQIILGTKDISKKNLGNLIIAYEPVWKIGDKSPMQSRDIHETSIFIKKILREIFGTLSEDIRVIYGGSVSEEYCKEILSDNFVEGFLIGRESLKPEDFLEIINITENSF